MWMIISLVAVFVIIVGGLALLSTVSLGPTPAPLQLASLSPAPASTTSFDGTWKVGGGSIAGFRVPESFLTQHGTIVGRSRAVTGTLVVAHDTITSGSFQVALSQLTIYGKPNASFAQLFDTAQYPDATLTLTTPVGFPSLPTHDQTISAPAGGALTLHGMTHAVTFTVTAHSNGSVLEAIGSASLRASDWGASSPFSVQNTAVIEFFVILGRG